ncbi:MAG: cell division protein FtsL [Candidatus Cloacimonadales bacterium]|nr:cell division protein FtsL [Candidatus Cloacimonadales bacterium]
MNRRAVILIVVFFAIIFVHYQNQHKILSYSRKTNELQENYKSQRDINLDLVSVNSQLGSRERIQNLAYDKLGMTYPEDATSVHNIMMNSRKETFCLVDFIVPCAEALTK